MEMYLSHHGVKNQQWGVRNGPPYPIRDPFKKARLMTGKLDPEEYIRAKELKRVYKDGITLPGKEKEYVYQLFDNNLSDEERKKAIVFCNSQYYTYKAINLGHNNYTIIDKYGINNRKVQDEILNDVLTEVIGVNWEDYDEPV